MQVVWTESAILVGLGQIVRHSLGAVGGRLGGVRTRAGPGNPPFHRDLDQAYIEHKAGD